MDRKEMIREIATEVGLHFRTFGGGVVKEQPLQFAAGVNVEQVVEYILDYADELTDPAGRKSDR